MRLYGNRRFFGGRDGDFDGYCVGIRVPIIERGLQLNVGCGLDNWLTRHGDDALPDGGVELKPWIRFITWPTDEEDA